MLFLIYQFFYQQNKLIMSEKIILGIDPGTTIMGFGILKVKDRKMNLVQMNELNLTKYKDHYLKLKLVFERTISLIEEYSPDEIAIEAPFFGKNVQSMLKLGRAHGCITIDPHNNASIWLGTQTKNQTSHLKDKSSEHQL